MKITWNPAYDPDRFIGGVAVGIIVQRLFGDFLLTLAACFLWGAIVRLAGGDRDKERSP